MLFIQQTKYDYVPIHMRTDSLSTRPYIFPQIHLDTHKVAM